VREAAARKEREGRKSAKLGAILAQGVKPISREDAKALGLTRYFTGVACKRGHVAERLLSTRHCVVCARAHSDAYREENPEESNAAARARYAVNPEKGREKSKAYREANPEKCKGGVKVWKSANPERVNGHARACYAANPGKAIEGVKAWQKANPDKVAAAKAKQRARKRNLTPTLTPEEKARELAIYAEGQREGWHVDHIKPLAKGGLHHPDNLIAIPPLMNLQKGAQYWPDLHALQ
jgi:hypothetical protein